MVIGAVVKEHAAVMVHVSAFLTITEPIALSG
jgi:hypothetical protein